MSDFLKTPKLVLLIWLALLISICYSSLGKSWSTVLISTITLLLTVLPVVYRDRFEIKIAAAIAIFVFATLFLEEVRD